MRFAADRRPCGAHTVPYIEVRNPSARVEHEATTSKISEDQLFYCRQRGLSDEDALSLIVNGFCKEVLKELPMEFAVEAQKLLAVSLEGSVGYDARSRYRSYGPGLTGDAWQCSSASRDLNTDARGERNSGQVIPGLAELE